VWRRPGLHPVDLLVFAALLALLFGLLRLVFGLLRLAPALNAPFLPRTAPGALRRAVRVRRGRRSAGSGLRPG
jgi:NitT/TauT family transport system permease protein